jgi:flagellar basal-body rod protein FlgF
MNHILSIVLTSMHADVARMDRVAMNLANVQTPGYKREVVAATPFAAQLEAAGSRLLAEPTATATPAVHTDTRAGTLKATGQSLDLALVGDGWFEVVTEQGPAYTRQGNFRLDARGRLVTEHGQPLQGTAGEIQLLHGTPVIDASGRIFEGVPTGSGRVPLSNTPVAQLRIVQFDRNAPLHRLGEGLVAIHGDPTAATEGAIQVQQGFLENSNVSHLHEMVRLMEAVRHFESMQKVAIGYDEMLAASIRRLGEP